LGKPPICIHVEHQAGLFCGVAYFGPLRQIIILFNVPGSSSRCGAGTLNIELLLGPQDLMTWQRAGASDLLK
jgi:hypothetical protein